MCLSAVSGLIHHHVSDEISMVAMHTRPEWKRACGKKNSKHSAALLQKNPGAGMDPRAVDPFTKVYKDGFMFTACVKDSMYVHGDKFGNNKDSYKIGATANSSIVHYSDHVAKEDHETMTHAVCFEFCRGVEDMGFFGISNGRDCYCAPYYDAMASDSSQCDAVCEGDTTQMCGGASKNSIFGMHSCADTATGLTTADEAAAEALAALTTALYAVNASANDGEFVANSFQAAFGAAGDPVAAGLMQTAKIFGGKCRDEAADAHKKAIDPLQEAKDIVLSGTDYTKAADAKAAEAKIKDMNAGIAIAEETLEAIQKTLAKITPEIDNSEGAAKQYYPVMYFVDKEYEGVPSTCGGDLAADPMMTVNEDTCAAACDALPGKCVGYGYYEQSSSLCFLYSKFKSVQYYTECAKFLQTSKKHSHRHKTSDTVTCKAKLQMFEGTTLKPDPEGKCKQCLKEATHANRCW